MLVRSRVKFSIIAAHSPFSFGNCSECRVQRLAASTCVTRDRRRRIRDGSPPSALKALFNLREAEVAHALGGVYVLSWTSALYLTLGLLCAESGISALTYVVAYACVLDEAPLAQRVRSRLPHAFVTGCWLVVYMTMGAGTRGMTLYRDLRTPLATLPSPKRCQRQPLPERRVSAETRRR